MTISGVEFIRRFLLHVLPKGFTKIRHYGLLTNRNKKNNIRLCRLLISRILTNDFINELTRKIIKPECKKCGSTNLTSVYRYNNKRLIHS